MSAVWPSAVDLFLTGALDVTTATLKVQLLGAYAYNPAHTVRADLTHLIGSPVTVTVDHVASGGVYLDAATVAAVPAGPHVLGVALYVDNGGTDPLVAFFDRRADRVLIDLTPNGHDVSLSWPNPAFTL